MPSFAPSLRWLHSRPDAEARARLFLFPYAGSGASVYRAWAGAFPPGIDVCAVQLPGREDRRSDPPATNLQALVSDLVDVLQPFSTRPIAFFGHSMGALLAFELTCRLHAQKRRLPVRLFLSAHRAPHRPQSAPRIHGLSDADFLAQVRRLNGTPDALLNDPEFMALALPLLRADFTLCETYDHRSTEPLDVPFSIFAGTDDRHVPVEDIEGWEQHSRRQTRVRLFSGDHFFLQHERTAIIHAITDDLEQDLRLST